MDGLIGLALYTQCLATVSNCDADYPKNFDNKYFALNERGADGQHYFDL